MSLGNVKLSTFDLCNKTSDKSAKARRDIILMTFIQKRKIMSTLKENTRLVEKEPKLEKISN